MENTIENKEKFFAQYWGQEVHKVKMSHSDPICKVGAHLHGNKIEEDYLELTPLSQIMDEHSLQVSKILDANFDENILSDSARIFHINRGKSHVLPSRPCRSDVCDYIRSKGYAMPYMGLSVEKQIGYGWIKLKNN